LFSSRNSCCKERRPKAVTKRNRLRKVRVSERLQFKKEKIMTVAEQKSKCEFSADGSKAVYHPGNGNVLHYTRHGGIYFEDGTDLDVIQRLLGARLYRSRVRIHYGYTDPRHEKYGQDWLEEHDVEGYVSCTLGPLKSPLLVYNRRSSGGNVILTRNIVKITVRGDTIYQHPNYKIGKFTIREIKPDELTSWKT